MYSVNGCMINFITINTCHVGVGENTNASQFYITTGEGLYNLDEKHTIFGQVAEGWDVLEAINDAPCDDEGRPLQNIRIRHTIILDDPTPNLPQLEEHIPETSPEPQYADDGRLEDDWQPDEDTKNVAELEEKRREQEAKNRAVVLEMIGDLPEADAAPPPTVLFICKLNPVTTEEDLEIIFSRFGRVTACDIIRDWKTGDSLCYGFIGFDSEAASEEAYFKMNNVLIDDRRIKVDFSQSVHHLWKQFKKHGRRGTAGIDQEGGTSSAHGGGSGRMFQLKSKYSRGPLDQRRHDYVFEDDYPTIKKDREADTRRYDRRRRDDDMDDERRRKRHSDRPSPRRHQRSPSHRRRKDRSRSRDDGKYRRASSRR